MFSSNDSSNHNTKICIVHMYCPTKLNFIFIKIADFENVKFMKLEVEEKLKYRLLFSLYQLSKSSN